MSGALPPYRATGPRRQSMQRIHLSLTLVLRAHSADRPAKLFAIGKNGGDQLPAARTVLQRVEFDRDLIARLHRIGAPTAGHVLRDRLHLEAPLARHAFFIR